MGPWTLQKARRDQLPPLTAMLLSDLDPLEPLAEEDRMHQTYSYEQSVSDQAKFRDFSQMLPASRLYQNIRVENRYGENDSRVDFNDWFSFLSSVDGYTRQTGMQSTGDDREFHYIRYGSEQFIYDLAPHMNKGVGSFIDVGCGGGDKLALIKDGWPHVHTVGIEHDPAMAAWARTVGDTVFCGDAFKISYKPYDVIYAFWPVANQKKMVDLAAHIVQSKRREAKFVLVGFATHYFIEFGQQSLIEKITFPGRHYLNGQ